VIAYFLAHRYDGSRLWNLQDRPWILPLVWLGSAISFFFLYPATYNLLEIPALLRPQVRLYGSGIIRISRHPQAVGQILWCATHLLWIGSSFMVATCFGLIAHHLSGMAIVACENGLAAPPANSSPKHPSCPSPRCWMADKN
jgi:uncharacterized membrane protein